MHNFKELKVWKKAIQLTMEIYHETDSFPGEEKFGLTSQIRRSAVSIASNIAEGCGKNTDRALTCFLGHSLGSQYELETQLIISKEVGMLDTKQFEHLIVELNEIQKMTHTLMHKFSESNV